MDSDVPQHERVNPIVNSKMPTIASAALNNRKVRAMIFKLALSLIFKERNDKIEKLNDATPNR